MPRGRAAARWLGWLGLALAGCKEPAPQRVLLEPPEQVLSREPVKALVWLWDAQGGKRAGSGQYVYNVQPPDLAQITSAGQLTCSRSGDGQVQVDVLGVSASAPLRCRLVDHIEAKDLGRIELNAGPLQLDLAAYTKEGERLADVPVAIATPNPSVVRASRTTLEPQQVGRATLEVRAGAVRKNFEVEVVRRVTSEALPMNNNQRIHYSLDAGTYELSVSLASEKRLNIEWRSAPYCNASAVAKEHKSVCVLRAKGGVVFDNPAFVEHGSKEISLQGVSLFEVPLR